MRPGWVRPCEIAQAIQTYLSPSADRPCRCPGAAEASPELGDGGGRPMHGDEAGDHSQSEGCPCGAVPSESSRVAASDQRASGPRGHVIGWDCQGLEREGYPYSMG